MNGQPKMNQKIKELAEQAQVLGVYQFYDDNGLEKFAELIVRECLDIVDQNTYGPCGEYDYSYSNENDAADTRARTIRDDIVSRFGIKE